jgi:hypothetical protein
MNNQSLTPYIPFGGADIHLGDDPIKSTAEYPLLQYATGLPARIPLKDEDGCDTYDEDGEQAFDDITYKGFFTQAGLDRELDLVMESHEVPYLYITHGGGETLRHWALAKPVVFLLAKGIPSSANTKGECGMVYTWRPRRTGAGQESVLHALVMIRQLLPEFSRPFVFTIRSTQTVDALNAFRRQGRVLQKAHEELQRIGRDMPLPLWSYAVLLGPSKKQETRGKEGAKKAIYPMLSGIPDSVDTEYLRRYEMPLEYADLLRDYAEKSVAWATEKMQAGYGITVETTDASI